MRILKITALCVAVLISSLIITFTYNKTSTEQKINELRKRVAQLGIENPAAPANEALLQELPAPVQNYFRFVFRGPVPKFSSVELTAFGDFRRPKFESFEPTTSEQVISIGKPSLMFSATTPILPGLTARVYDFYAEGEMEMIAKLAYTITVVDESETPELNRISLRRWLLESPLCPQALLPGGPVRWQAVDENSARAVVSAYGFEASMLVFFDNEGRITHMMAEEDGDLNTPYHGSGEHVTRSDYRQVGNQMIPHAFTISRAANGKIYPFWKGNLTSIRFIE